ncbi:C-type lectin domain family 4 member G-like [Scomber scombrus]|uniref:C-type lectin domain family 4 member G-like n=1 Tax=Scomber scombrus TaxID=13677 RepID=UPI002DDA17E4|nr:C-type lectin domain family 4 member G-like [Scomber scombrus]
MSATSVTSVISGNNNKLTAENQKLETNLTKEYNDSEMKIKKLTAENQQLKTQNQELKTLNILIEQIRKIKKCNTVTQRIIDAYCPIKDGSNNVVYLLASLISDRQCGPCLQGWLHHQSSCYGVYNPNTAGQKTWEEAQENCRRKKSDLAVIVNEDEKKFISDNSWGSSGFTGYWIGLRAEADKWKWIDGSDLTERSWMTQPAANSACAISVYNQGWRPVWCEIKSSWICKKAALSV